MNFLDARTSLLTHLRLAKYSPATIDNYTDQLKRFGEWLAREGLLDLRQITKTQVDAYRKTAKIKKAVTPHLLRHSCATGYVHVRQGKGGKDRVVPLGQSVCALLDTYMAGVRGDWCNAEATDYLFLNRWGNRMDPNAIWAVVHKCAKRAGIKKPVSTHTFRHTCATHMLRNGAPIRHLQEMLGHASLETTQEYTRITINDLKAAHGQYHPREREQHKQS